MTNYQEDSKRCYCRLVKHYQAFTCGGFCAGAPNCQARARLSVQKNIPETNAPEFTAAQARVKGQDDDRQKFSFPARVPFRTRQQILPFLGR
jgi:hypothetical protein